MPDTRPLCITCIDYTSPSVRHVPWTLDLNGETALCVLLRRFSTAYPESIGSWIICLDPYRLGTVKASADRCGWKLFVAEMPLVNALSDFVQKFKIKRDLLILPATAIIPDSSACKNLLRVHQERQADATVAADPLLDGLAPLVLRSAVTGLLAENFPECSDVGGLISALRSGPRHLKVLEEPSESAVEVSELQALPATPVLSDCWAQRAAAAAIEKPSPLEANKAFKDELIANLDELPEFKAPVARAIGRTTVLFTSMRVSFSGAEASLFSLISNLRRERYRPIALLQFESLLAEKLRRAGVETIVAGWDYSICTPRNIAYCQQILDAYTPDLVHMDLVPILTLMIAARTRGLPILAHVRTVPDCVISPLVSMADRLIAVSKTVERRLLQFNLPRSQVVMIYNGVSLAHQGELSRMSARSALGIPLDAFVVAIVSRLTPLKRVDVFLQAMARVMAERPNIWAMIVGEPCPTDLVYAHRLRKYAMSEGIADRTTWVPFEENMEHVFGTIDGLVHCCWREALPRSVLEALAAGIPVIVPNVAGASELVEPGISGLTFTADSVDELAPAILDLATDSKLRNEIREQARKRAMLFSIEQHVERVQNLYDEVLRAKVSAVGSCP